jgi:hypothetical protein
VRSNSFTRVRPAALIAALVLVAVLLAGCGGGDDDDETETAPGAGQGAAAGGEQSATPGVYVGQVGATDSSIALVTDGSRLTGAFLCVPKSTAQWVRQAPLDNGNASLVARRGVVLGTARFADDTATGTVQAGGENDFSAKVASGYAGLYRTTSGTTNEPGFSETGWIVLPNGQVCGGTNTITAGGGFESKPAPSKPDGSGRVTDFSNPFPF